MSGIWIVVVLLFSSVAAAEDLDRDYVDIARHDLQNDAPDPSSFATADILYAARSATSSRLTNSLPPSRW